MNPAPPVTRILIVASQALRGRPPLPRDPRWRQLPSASGADLDFAVITKDQAMRSWHPGRRCDLDVMPDQRCLDPPNTLNGSPAQHDRVLDLAFGDKAFLSDRGERANVGGGDPGARADDRRPDNARTADLCAALDHDAADDLAGIIHGAGQHRLDAF